MSIKIDDIYCKHLLKFTMKYKSKKHFFLDKFHIVLCIADSIHYNSLLHNDFSDYEKLLKTSYQPEHSLNNFKELINAFDIHKMGKIKLIHNMQLNKYIICDGLHRCSIILFNKIFGNNSIPLKLLNIQYDNASLSYISECLKATTNIKFHYNGWNNRRTLLGYHSFNMCNINLNGQRNPKKRLNIIKKYVDFKNKTIVDFGCNCGGMLFHIPEIKEGYGYDYDAYCVAQAKKLIRFFKYNNKLVFKKYDLNKLTTFKNELPEKIDIIFLLSLGSWIKNWRNLYNFAIERSKLIILETNNNKEGEPQLDFFRKKGTDMKLISSHSTDDITGNHGRKTYLITTQLLGHKSLVSLSANLGPNQTLG